MNSGFVFLEVIDSLEKIGDRVVNIAESLVGKMKWESAREKKQPTKSINDEIIAEEGQMSNKA